MVNLKTGDWGLAVPAFTEYTGLSTDTKPTTGVPKGALFMETDTGKIYGWKGTGWVLAGGTATLPSDVAFTDVNNAWTVIQNLPNLSTIGTNTVLSSTGLTAPRTFTFPDVNDTLVGLAATQTLTNKTIDSELNTVKNQFHSYDYVFYPSGGSYKARKVSTGVITTNSDFVTLLAAAITDMNTTGGKFLFLSGKYIINSVIAIPTYTYTATFPFVFEGAVYPALRNQGGVYFEVGSSFPNQRYMFESISAGGSNNTSIFEIRNIFAGNVHYGAQGDGVHNLDGNTSPIINAGFCHFESDLSAGFRAPCVIENIVFQYLWRGIHLTGYMFWPIVRNIATDDISTSFQGDTWILVDLGTGHSDKVKMLTLENLRLGTNGIVGMTGNMNNAIVLSGGYHRVRNVFVDGKRYNDSVIALKQCFSATLYDVYTIDLVTGTDIPATFKGVFLFDSTSPEGVAGNSSYWCYNNQIYGCSAAPSNYSFAFRNSPFRNYIQTFGYWGAVITIDDAAAGTNNIFEIIEGQALVATTNTKISSTNSLVRIKDTRSGASTRGLSATQSGDGTTTVFNIAHGCFATPAYVSADAVTADSRGTPIFSATSTNIVITYPIAPPTGTNNLQWYYEAEVYT